MADDQGKANQPSGEGQANTANMDQTGSKQPGIDRNAPAGTPSSLGAESVRDGRPSTNDSVVEAIDEEGPGIPQGQ